MKANGTSRACVVSDLHMFCARSEWDQYYDALHRASLDVDHFIFNGDTFDFRWTTLDTVEDTVEEALAWLKKFADNCPDCQVHFILGNHDYHHTFVDGLRELTAATPNLSWYPYYLKLGRTVFLHGDVAEYKMDSTELARKRSRWLHDKKKGKTLNKVHNAAFRLRIHRALHKVAFPKRIVARRILSYLEDLGHTNGDSFDEVFFGHTHLPVDGYRYKDVAFHNGGAPLRGLKFRLIHTEVEV
jgi:UDP-2,3-diacylglucosamine hydrolase